MVFQQFNLFPHLTVLENLTLAPLRVRKLPRKDAEDTAMAYLTRVRISGTGEQVSEPAVGRPAATGGDRPCVVHGATGDAVRRAGPGAQPEMIKEVLDVMVELAEEHMTMICVTHEMGFARTVADTMVFMDHGQIVRDIAAEGILASPKSERTRLFLSQVLAH